VTKPGPETNGTGIYVQRYNAAGVAQGSEAHVNTYTFADQTQSAVTGLNAAGGGGFVVTWTSATQDGSGTGIYARKFDATGVAGTESLVNTITTGSQSEPAVTTLSNGGYVVSWTSPNSTSSVRNIVGQVFSSTGLPVGSEFTVAGELFFDASGVSISATPDGGFVATWDNDYEARSFSRFNATGTLVETQNSHTGADVPFDGPPVVSALDNGHVVMVSRGQSYSQLQVNRFELYQVGTQQPDVLNGTPQADNIYGVNANPDLFTVSSYNQQNIDELHGLGGDDTLAGGAGADIIDGGDGSDTASYRYDYGPISAFLNFGFTSNTYESTFDTLISIENVIGSSYNDTIAGNNVENFIDGGAGNDTAYYYYSASGVYVDLTANTAQGGDAEGDTLISIENVIGSFTGDDILTGSDGSNFLNGYGGNDSIDGRAGGDSLFGGNGDDILKPGAGFDYAVGGNGTDTVDYSTSASGVLVHLLFGGGASGDASGDGIETVENVIGSSTGANTIYGNFDANELTGGSGVDQFVGFSGADKFFGDIGFDTVIYTDSAEGINVDLGSSNGLGGDAEGDSYYDIEGIIGTQFKDTLTGQKQAEFLSGGAGNDIILGKEENDTLSGGTGADQFVYNFSNYGYDVITDFENGSDHIVFDPSVASQFADLTILSLSATSAFVYAGDASAGITVNTQNALLTLTQEDFFFQ
jgi:Ca2+-binding RTX toxin-like protein